MPILPKEYCSKLENIFLAQLHSYVDHKRLRNKQIFTFIIDQIKDLQENGITVNINGHQKKIFFVLPFVCGDNLGLNTILGYTKSFNAMYYCRICTISKPDLKKQTKINPILLRTKESYDNHCLEKSFGIQERCIFHQIPNFHVTENFSVDPMHDLLEGICRYDMGKILNQYINENQYFSLEILNERMACSSCGLESNIPPPFHSESIKNEMNREMNFVVNNFCVIIGDLVEKKNLSWKLYLMLRKIVCITMADSLTEELIDNFDALVSKYLSLYLRIFKKTLKVKHHLLVHDSQIMRKFGPLKNMSTIRPEAKHKQIKETSKVISNRKNPSYSLSLKHQLQFCYRLVNNSGFIDELSYGSVLKEAKALKDFHKFEIQLLKYSENVSSNYTYKWIKTKGTQYEINNVINVSSKNFNFLFGKIKVIIIDEKKAIFCVYVKLNIVKCCPHLNAFEINETDDWDLHWSRRSLSYNIYYVCKMSDTKYYIPSEFLF